MVEMARASPQPRVWLEFDYEKKEKKKEGKCLGRRSAVRRCSACGVPAMLMSEQRDKKKDGMGQLVFLRVVLKLGLV